MNRIWAINLALMVLVLDQWTKCSVAHAFSLYESRTIVPGFFDLTYTQNTGGAFSILQGWGGLLTSAGGFAALGILGLLVRAERKLPPIQVFAMGLPLGGTIGNLIDRIRLGYVVDFFDAYIGTHHWPIFNVADSSICIGVGLLALWLWRKPDEASQPAAVKGES